MKRMLLILSFVMTLTASAVEVKPYADAVKSGRDVLVLCVGTGWMPQNEKYIEAFKAAAGEYEGAVEFALYDRPMGLSSEEVNALGHLPCEFFGYPCLIFRDAEGRPILQRERVTLASVAKTPAVATHYAKLCAERDAALKAARALPDGPAKAAALGKALAPILDPIISTYSERAIASYQNSVRGIVNEIRRADPSDAAGWATKYSFCYLPLQEGKIWKGSYEANQTLINDYLKMSALLPIQRQMVYCMRFKNEMQRAGGEGSIGPALQALRDGIALDPKSTLAEAMRNMIEYYTAPVRLRKMGWENRDNRPRFQKAVLNCASVVKSAGNYRVEFRARTGGTSFRNVKFVGNPEGAKQNGNVWLCSFSGEGRPILELEIRGSGWFSGNGDIIITKE